MNRTVHIVGFLLAIALAVTPLLGTGLYLPAHAAEMLQEEETQPTESTPAEPDQSTPGDQPDQPEEASPLPEQSEATEEPPPQPEQPTQPQQPVEPVVPEQPIEPVVPEQPIAKLPAIAINIPVEGEVTSAVEVVVVGVGQALPENNVVVQAKDSAGTVLDGRPTTVQAPLGGEGQWRVTLQPNVAPGTPGTIEAFSQSPATGEILASDTINVVFGAAGAEPTPTPTQPALTPAINIRIPIEGETTSAEEVVVVGDGVALPENNVVVQAIDENGAILDQAATTVKAPLGGEGEWRAILHPEAVRGTAGSIVAFSASPATGETLAQDSVNVTYGTAEPSPTATPVPPPVESRIEINIPVDGETTSNREVVVVGTGAGLPENNVVVESLDASGRVLDRRATTVNADLGGEGEWRVTLYPDVSVGTQGRIVASSTSPATGRVLATDTVFVTYGQYVPPSNITIRQPRSGDVLRTDSPIGVSGTAQNLFENNVVVRVVSAQGAILAEQPTISDSHGSWSVDVGVPQVNTQARIIAYSPSPVDNTYDAYDEVRVELVGRQPTPVPGPHIKIAAPPNNSVVNTTNGFTVFGTANGTFENNVVVRVLDSRERILRQIATTANEDGNWNVTVNMLITHGSPASIRAFSTSPVDGSIVAEDSVEVTFVSACTPRTDWPIYTVEAGDTLFTIAQRTGSTVGELVLANCLPNPNRITVGEELRVPQLPGEIVVIVPPEVYIVGPDFDEVVSTSRPVVIDGEAAGITEGNVFVRALDSMGTVLDEQRVNVTRPTDPDGTWTWEVDLDLFDANPGSRGMLLAYARNVTDGSILVADTRSIVFDFEPTGPWVTIETPIPYANTAEDGIVTIVGRGSGLFENNVVVEVQDDVGNVLSIAPTIVDTDEIGGTGFWEVKFAVDRIGRGAVVAYATEPVNGSRVAEARTDVFYGDPRLQDDYVVVTYPLPNTIVTGAASILSAAGYAGGIDPDTLRVVVMDANSRIIMTLPALVDTETGQWSVNLSGPLSVDRDQRATIHALAGNGAVTAADVVPLQVEQPEVTGYVTYLQRIALPPDAVVHIMLQNTSIADAPPEVTMLGEEYITDPGQVPIPFAVKYNAIDVDQRVNYGLRVRIEDGDGQLLFINTQSVPVLTQGNPSRNIEVLVESMR